MIRLLPLFLAAAADFPPVAGILRFPILPVMLLVAGIAATAADTAFIRIASGYPAFDRFAHP
jgi:hypothetical protein